MRLERKQTTVAREAELRGVGLHTGAEVALRLTPAPADYGVVFVRTDLPGEPRVPVCPEGVAAENLRRRTELRGEGGAGVATTEHLLAACAGLGLDNVRVELDGPEVPILDGSGLPFVELIDRAGLRELEPRARAWRLQRPVSMIVDGAEIHAIPAEAQSMVFFAMLGGLGLANQCAEITLNGAGDAERFRAQVAPARTWVRYEDVEQLRAAGLIRGGSLESAIVLREGLPMQTAYRMANELAAHKLLDLMGDFAILGRPVHALITARGSGHALNFAFVEQLRKELAE